MRISIAQGSPDICIVSACGKPFPMHKKVLSVSSEMFSNLFDASIADPQDAVDGLPAIKMQERCEILTVVLPYCYDISYARQLQHHLGTHLQTNRASGLVARTKKYGLTNSLNILRFAHKSGVWRAVEQSRSLCFA